MVNIYTIGKSSWYDKWMAEQGNNFRKKGRTISYPGGSAYTDLGTAMRALRLIKDQDYSLYRLDTTVDNLYKLGDNFHIKESCRILKL